MLDLVRLALAALMAVTLTAATIADRVACPDGCTDEAPIGAPSTGPSLCGLCHGWSGDAPALVSVPRAAAVTPPAAPESRERSPHLASIDHPPRIA